MDFLECSLCNNQYDESKRRARTLFCAHYFCQDCLDQVIKSSAPRCPTCRANITTISAENLPPNFLMDDILSKMKTGIVSVDLKGDEDFSAGSCLKHKGCKLYFTCKSHNLEICRECTVVDHPSSRCQIVSFEDELNEKKQKTLDKLDSEELNIDKNINVLKTSITNTRSQIEEQYAEIVKLKRKIQETILQIGVNEVNIISTDKTIKVCIENKISITAMKKELASTKSVKKINSSLKDAECIITKSKAIQFEGKYLTAEINGEKRFAILALKSGYIHLPALSQCGNSSAPIISSTISHLLARFQWINADIYLELESDGEELGTVYVELKQDQYSQYIRKLCMGTIGPCYRGAIFKGRDGHSIYTGDVTEYDTSSCTAFIRALPNRELLQRGSLYIENETGLRFCISDPITRFARVVGNVNEGLNVLDAAWNFPKGEVKVKDVGIVLRKFTT